MKNLKRLREIIGSALVGAGLLASSPARADDNCSGYYEFGIGAIYESPIVKSINNIPAEIRNVTYENGEKSCIEDDSVEPYGRISPMRARGGVEFSLGKTTIARLGAFVDLNFDATTSIDSYDERRDSATLGNKTPAANSSKAAKDSFGNLKCYDYVIPEEVDLPGQPDINYYSAYTTYWDERNAYFRPGIFSELEFKINDENAVRLGCDLFEEEIRAENGYSSGYARDSAEEKVKRRFELAKLLVARPSVSYNYTFEDDSEGRAVFSVEAGLDKVINKDFTDTGKQADFKFDDNAWFVGVRLRGEF